MLRRTMTVVLALTLVMAAGSAFGQSNCVVGAYADDGGTLTSFAPQRDPFLPTQFDVFYVLFAEDFLNAVAWNTSASGFGGGPGVDLFVIGQESEGTYGTFLDSQPQGFRLGIGDCVIGFGGNPIVLMRQTFLLNPGQDGGTISVTANTLEHPTNPVYNSCVNEIKPCNGGTLTVQRPIPTEAKSFGRVKALYNVD